MEAVTLSTASVLAGLVVDMRKNLPAKKALRRWYRVLFYYVQLNLHNMIRT